MFLGAYDPMHEKILITTALPYANGSIHLGHILEQVLADIWCRFHKLCGQNVLFIGGNDAHGTPVMLRAQKEGVSPLDLVRKIHAQHRLDFAGFGIDFDHFDITHAPENATLLHEIFDRMQKRKDVCVRTIAQLYDPLAKLFLPDRYVKGTCPACGAKDQYGDHCEACSATYAPCDLSSPYSALSGAAPVEKESEHYFFKLQNYTHFLETWLNSNALQLSVKHKLTEWLEQGLKAWDISRDAPYFGFQIPGESHKYFYVWVDAPIGYMACFQKLCKIRPELSFAAYWDADAQTHLYHFVGKDIIYFHALFWPALLKSAGFRLPTAVFAHGFLTVNGQKMSKSRGTFITAQKYLQHAEPDCLRYYFAAKLGPDVADIDLNLSDFRQRVNADLIGKYINIASRCAGFITRLCDGRLAPLSALQLHAQTGLALHADFIAQAQTVHDLYLARNYGQVVRTIMQLADRANRYIQTHKPWKLCKLQDPAPVQAVCSIGLNLFRILSLYLKPIVPKIIQSAEQFLHIPPLLWEDRGTLLHDHSIATFKPLLARIAPTLDQTLLQDQAG